MTISLGLKIIRAIFIEIIPRVVWAATFISIAFYEIKVLIPLILKHGLFPEIGYNSYSLVYSLGLTCLLMFPPLFIGRYFEVRCRAWFTNMLEDI